MLRDQPILHFKSKMFADIAVSGLLQLRAERKFKLFRDFELTVFDDDAPLLSVASKTKMFQQHIEIVSNPHNFSIAIASQKQINIDNHCFEFKVNKLYLIQKKYADVLLDEMEIGTLQFIQKFPNFHLDFYPSQNFDLNADDIKKLAISTLINIADLDGSE